MSEIVVRPVRPEEHEAVGAMTVAAYQADGLLVADPEYVHELADAARRAEQGELLVAVSDEGELLGSVTIVRPGTPYSEISREGELEFRMLSTAPTARGRGVGEALTRAVLNRARELGACRVVLSSLESMTTAHRLYDRLGFERLPERDWQPVPNVWLRAYAAEL
ncbi:ribosomal protein S18 acetylase RimI-like enzyme [Amycolatopsis bartoniae]|uniref:GNAT family N-acetyltransferase n=1 Tax=Amycolatopsis bartoniae TaxID=941986 RepID=UPI001193BF37|nr:GNAT family N-acetyltransferase [Amycolatopsis bartoniae]MBB2936106.1 ribosomal protein S18 acetylase RimI-like enzyme [Amycolatopsis bartoniae]TVS99617.1 GNAT family N-acetyltransferase [Amycolatopsis bartoniae]